jgi:hypothetical protein
VLVHRAGEQIGELAVVEVARATRDPALQWNRDPQQDVALAVAAGFGAEVALE